MTFNRDGLATEMLGLARKPRITDIFDWNGQKLEELKDAKDIPDHALAAIKKINLTMCIAAAG